jgi:hypothetical protein
VRLYRENDANQVLAEFEQAGGLPSPRDVLVEISQYLTTLQSAYAHQMPRETADAIADTLARIQAALQIHDSNMAKLDKVTEMTKQITPLEDMFFLSSRLRLVVNWELEQKINDGSISNDIALIMHLALKDNLKPLDQFNVIDFPRMKTQDIPNAEYLANANLPGLEKTFDVSFAKTFEMLSRQQSSSSTAASTHSLDVLCMQALSIPSAPAMSKTNLNNFCRGRTLAVTEGGHTLKLSFDDLITKDFDHRVCSYYDFQRKARLASIQADRRIKPLR